MSSTLAARRPPTVFPVSRSATIALTAAIARTPTTIATLRAGELGVEAGRALVRLLVIAGFFRLKTEATVLQNVFRTVFQTRDPPR
jgi:hypothetical protein